MLLPEPPVRPSYRTSAEIFEKQVQEEFFLHESF
jgi:hypothetical protein